MWRSKVIVDSPHIRTDRLLAASHFVLAYILHLLSIATGWIRGSNFFKTVGTKVRGKFTPREDKRYPKERPKDKTDCDCPNDRTASNLVPSLGCYCLVTKRARNCLWFSNKSRRRCCCETVAPLNWFNDGFLVWIYLPT